MESKKENKTHDCLENLDKNCKCTVCMKISHANSEPLYIVEQSVDDYFITGFTERKVAEKFGVRHLTVIIVPFVADGENAGKWIVHDRTAKQWAKGKLDCKTPSYNLFGGHCTADVTQIGLIGSKIPQEICDSAAKRELEEELLCFDGSICLEIWENKRKTDCFVNACPYEANDLIPIGFSSYADKDNIEFSYIYALPVPEKDLSTLVAADNYVINEMEHNVSLPIVVLSEIDLLVLSQTDYSIEVCDAITRLWNAENKVVIDKLRTVIKKYQ